jgi:hypothetical protein
MTAVGFVLGFLPWIVYWILVGNSPFPVAVLVALAACAGGLVVNRLRGQPWRTLDVGTLGVFAVLTVAAFVFPDAVLERWLQPLGNAGLFLVALVGVLIGRPFVREYAEAAVDPEIARTDGFGRRWRSVAGSPRGPWTWRRSRRAAVTGPRPIATPRGGHARPRRGAAPRGRPGHRLPQERDGGPGRPPPAPGPGSPAVIPST